MQMYTSVMVATPNEESQDKKKPATSVRLPDPDLHGQMKASLPAGYKVGQAWALAGRVWLALPKHVRNAMLGEDVTPEQIAAALDAARWDQILRDAESLRADQLRKPGPEHRAV